jgi:hypothetical protein
MRRILLSLLFVALGATAASACECEWRHQKEFRRAKSIFVGEAVSVGTHKITNPKISDQPLYPVTLKVLKRWKGARGGEVTLLTDSCASMCCQIKFNEGKKYLVYVYEDSFVPSDCALSAELGSHRAEVNMKDLNRFWFRLKARLWPF